MDVEIEVFKEVLGKDSEVLAELCGMGNWRGK